MNNQQTGSSNSNQEKIEINNNQTIENLKEATTSMYQSGEISKNHAIEEITEEIKDDPKYEIKKNGDLSMTVERNKRLHTRPDMEDEIFPSQKKFKSSVKKNVEERLFSDNVEVSTITFDKNSPPSKIGEEKQRLSMSKSKSKVIPSLSPIKSYSIKVGERSTPLTKDSIKKKEVNLKLDDHISVRKSIDEKTIDEVKLEKNIEKTEEQETKEEKLRELATSEVKKESTIIQKEEEVLKENKKDLTSSRAKKNRDKEIDDETIKHEYNESTDSDFEDYFKKSENIRSKSKKIRRTNRSKTPMKSKSKERKKN